MPRPPGSRDELSPAAPRALRRARPAVAGGRGAVTWVGLLLAVLVAGGAYLAWVWGPVYALHYDVKQVARDFGNQAVKNPDDAGLVKALSERLKGLAQERVVGEDGKVASEPVVKVEPQDITWERLPGNQLHIAFSYERQVELPWLDRWVPKTFAVDLLMDVSRPDWGKP